MMFNKKDKPDRIIMRGHAFTNQEFEFLMNSFKESFSQASLSIERAFYILKKRNLLNKC